MKIAILAAAAACGLISGCAVYEPAPYRAGPYPQYRHYDRDDDHRRERIERYDNDRERHDDHGRYGRHDRDDDGRPGGSHW